MCFQYYVLSVVLEYVELTQSVRAILFDHAPYTMIVSNRQNILSLVSERIFWWTIYLGYSIEGVTRFLYFYLAKPVLIQTFT